MARLANLSLLSAVFILLGGILASEPVAQAAAAPAQETPAAFVKRLYAQYATKGGQDKVSKNFTDPSFVQLMDENAKVFGAFGDADLDYDPICQCQDLGSGAVFVDGKPSEDGGGCVAHIRRGKGKDQVDWQLILKPSGASWKVYDVIDQSGSLRALLTRHNECAKAAKRDNKSDDGCVD